MREPGSGSPCCRTATAPAELRRKPQASCSDPGDKKRCHGNKILWWIIDKLILMFYYTLIDICRLQLSDMTQGIPVRNGS